MREQKFFLFSLIFPYHLLRAFQPESWPNLTTRNPTTSAGRAKAGVLYLTEGNGEEKGFTRKIFLSGAFAAVNAAVTPAYAAVKGAKGAAEYDMEFYLRDLLKGNTREGNLPASSTKETIPPRKLTVPRYMLDVSCSQECVPAQMLSKYSGKSAEAVAEAMAEYRFRSSKAFASRTQWMTEDISDQYYFDLTAYALWRAASDLIPDFFKRDKFARDIGREIYKESKKSGLLVIPPLVKSLKGADGSKEASNDIGQLSLSRGLLTGTVPAVVEILDLFNSTEFCSNYRLGGDDSTQTGYNVFDELDDQDLQDGTSVNCLVSIYEPATLGAALQINGEGSRFSPEFVGATLSALWEEVGINASFETYFVDQEYRPNPKDFFPDEQLLQFTLTRKK